MQDSDFNFTQAMTELEEINEWFQEEDIDLEAALKKLRRGKELIQNCQNRLKEVESEFVEIKESFPEANIESDVLEDEPIQANSSSDIDSRDTPF